ncbi:MULTISPECIES: hypothetical protein [unclassified Tenacibaculum]|uniref:hypothetical protein n=1 Tax=unclassified Tenacibaculum TaxID=2635139 RepID=UPI001F24E3F6|nr:MULTISPECIES: hypothetical protein [unclassified Tenacibaculum]MCF2875517.1 hypothetical protein [Tenacibaculum sp. Cn5-1]MCF2935593.1 hypothetical protein [Tenacibaculum sp. Cn5-34]MCG7512153.1 hypothetical protein [Tenacibaculum sp. Cn5-46]
MKKSILKIGVALNKAEQKLVSGGFKTQRCNTDSDCCNFPHNSSYGYVCNAGAGVCVPGIFWENPCGL